MRSCVNSHSAASASRCPRRLADGVKYDNLHDIISGISYKPSFVFELSRPLDEQQWPYQDHTITVNYTAPDSGNPSRAAHLTGRFAVPYYLVDALPDESEFLRWFRSTVIMPIESHEADEFFRYKGVLIHNPHAPQPPLRFSPPLPSLPEKS